ncbi:hypothetical protein niasHT_014281 [Heterodera trifolii]|uniref:Nuclear receptor domain-containing protein n=1 Tax=Heterodera trifolii TaxID=157864 RepID=A0ABD2LKB4_9BILA
MLDDVAAEWCLDGETFIGQTINSFEHGEWAAAAANSRGMSGATHFFRCFLQDRISNLCFAKVKMAGFVTGEPSTSAEEKGQQQKGASGNICVVCGDESDGLHFGRFTCRACAAFFRRTVSLKLQYSCKRKDHCEVDKAARNMCRACRYQKCLRQGMLTTAVQHSRDGIGKRSGSVQRERLLVTSTGTSGEAKIARGASEAVSSSSSSAGGPQALIGIQQKAQHLLGTAYGRNRALSPCSSSSALLLDQAANAATIVQLNAAPGHSSASAFGPFSSQHHYAGGDFGAGVGVLSPYFVGNFPNLQQLGTSVGLPGHGPLQVTAQPQQQCPASAEAVELKYLRRMLEGYQHFLSLRKASYTLVDGFPLSRRDNEDCPQSNFGTSKKICKIEASLIMDIVENFFHPFGQLPAEDKRKMFDTFYCLFSNAERAFRTYKMFGAEDDRLLMPDGGYVRLSELQKFYENNTLVRGDPSQVAKIFENAMHYLVKTVVAHMRHIGLTETELIALFGIFIWSDSEEISRESLQMALQVRNDIIVDLHMHYRSQGLSEAEVTLKTANVFLLIPKLENSVRFLREDFNIASIFGMVNNSDGDNAGGGGEDAKEEEAGGRGRRSLAEIGQSQKQLMKEEKEEEEEERQRKGGK